MLQYCAKTEVDLLLSLCMNTITWFCHLVTFKWFFHSINYDFFTKLDEWFWILLINDFFLSTYVWMIDISHDEKQNKKSFSLPYHQGTSVRPFRQNFEYCISFYVPGSSSILCVDFWIFFSLHLPVKNNNYSIFKIQNSTRRNQWAAKDIYQWHQNRLVLGLVQMVKISSYRRTLVHRSYERNLMSLP